MAARTLVIGNRNYSSWSLRPWLFMKQNGIAFEEVRIPLYQASSKERLLRYSPSGKVPVLVEGETGQHPGQFTGHTRSNKTVNFPGEPAMVGQFVSVRADPLPRNPGGKVLKPALRESVTWEKAPRAG